MYPAFSYPASSPDLHPFSPRYCTGGGGDIWAIIYAKNITTMKHYFLFLIAWLSFSLSVAHAQHHAFSGRVTDTQRQPLVGVRVLLSRGDSLMAACLTDAKGRFALSDLPADTFRLQMIFPGFTTIEETCPLTRDLRTTFVMNEEMTGRLDEVTVTASASGVVRRTATGEVFRLSDSARASGDPYHALREIPRLAVNESLQTVSMIDGSQLLVLIDGRMVNSGITPIDPKDIETVELIDAVGARYVQMGVRHILNIRLKKKRDPYLFFEAATRHDIPRRHSFGVVYFEVGNPKASLYGRAVAEGTHHDDSRIDSRQSDVRYLKTYDGQTRSNDGSLIGELLFKWSMSPRDYWALHAYGWKKHKTSESNGQGELRMNTPGAFTYEGYDKNDAYVLTSSLYYLHDFSDRRRFEATLDYNRNSDTDKGDRREVYVAPHPFITDYSYDNRRTSAGLNADYSASWGEASSLNIGTTLRGVSDRVEKFSYPPVPVFRHREWNGYVYASFSSRLGRLYYMASAGLEAIRLTAGDATNAYLKPRISTSATLNLGAGHSTRLSYTLTNRAPSIGQLNPYNTSTDPLVITRGNPALQPEQWHNIALSHTYGRGGLYLMPAVYVDLASDLIQAHAYNDVSHFVRTYRNAGRYATLSAGGMIQYRFKDNRGSAYISAYHIENYFEGLSPRRSLSLGAGAWYTWGRWYVGGDISYRNYTYTPFSRTRQLTPEYSQVQVNYNFTKDFYIALALPYFIGRLATETDTQADSYSAYFRQEMISQSFRPWVLLRYTIRRNAKSKIRLDNVVHSREEGISL